MGRRVSVCALVLLLHAVPARSQFPAAPSPVAEIGTHVVLRVTAPARKSPAASASAADGFGLPSVERIHQRFAITKAEPLLPTNSRFSGASPLTNVWLVETPAGTDLDSLLDAYRHSPEVVYAERDRLMSLFDVNDSLFQWQWSLQNTGQSHPAVFGTPGSSNDVQILDSGLAGADIGAHDVLTVPAPEGQPPVVAILDTGVDPTHPELAGVMWVNEREIPANLKDDDHNGYIDDRIGWDHSGDLFQIPPPTNGDANPADYQGHGTHCAGIVAARSNNSRGIAGVAGGPNACRIMAVKIFPLALTSISARALVYAVDNGADVISMSWGGPWRTQVLEDAIHYALDAGVVLVAASGNWGDDMLIYPAAYPGVIAVGATDHNDRVTVFSSIGDHISLVAPGLDVLSLRAAGTDMYAPVEPFVHKVGNGYYLSSGTSMAAPHVAGAVARLLGVSPGLDPASVRTLLESTARDLVDPYGHGDSLPGRDPISGAGRLDLAQLLANAPHDAAQIVSPSPHQILTGTVAVTGTAFSDANLPYVLEYGKGVQPDEWVTITEAAADLKSSELGQWNTSGLDGLYSLRLRVGEANASTMLVFVGNSRLAAITSPSDGDSLVSWVDIKGSASDPDFHAYLIELGEGQSPSSWTMFYQGTRPVVDDLLASWQSGDREDGWYSFRVRLITDSGEVAGDTVSFYMQSTFSTARAWKVPLGSSSPALVASFGNLDTDPALEIVVGTSDGIRAFQPNGQPDLPMQSYLARTGSCKVPVAIGDVDGDGRDDLVAVNDSGVIWIFPSTEQARAILAPERPLVNTLTGIEEYIQPTLFLKDIDGDNRDEIHYFGGFSAIDPRAYWVYKSSGAAPPLKFSAQIFGDPLQFMEYLPADLDGDGMDEMYVGMHSLYRYDQAGHLTGSVALTDSAGHSAKALSFSTVDIDQDGNVELIVLAVVTASPARHILLAFEDDLKLVPTWPRETGIEAFWTPSEPVFCDIDGDGNREYFISWFDSELGRVSAWRPDGVPLSGHSSYSVWTSSIDPAKFRSPIATDLNADGLADLISCATEDMYLTFPVERIIAWNQLGQVLPGWPVVLESGGPLVGSSRRQTTACGDIDRNGLTDVMMVTSENNLVFLNVPGAPFDSAAPRVEFWRYNRSLNNTVEPAGSLRVVALQPTRLQPDVPVNTMISVQFDAHLLPTLPFSSLIRVEGSASGPHTGTVQYDPAAKSLIFDSDLDFVIGDTVTVHIAQELWSDSFKTLPREFVSTFMIGAGIPGVLNPLPSPGSIDVDRFTPLSLQFTMPMDTSFLSDTSVSVMGSLHGLYPGTLTYEPQTRAATFTPTEPFAPADEITVRVLPGVASTQGIFADSEFAWSFRVAWPQAKYTVPAPFSAGAPRSTYVSLVIDGALPDFAVNDSALLVYSHTSGREAGAVTFIPSTRSLRFMPTTPFRLGERLTAVAPALRWVWSFNINSVGGPMHFTPSVTFPTDASPRMVSAGDVDGNGRVELVAGRDESPYAYILHRSSGGALSVDSVLTGGSLSQALLADLDGDGDLELIGVDRLGRSLSVLMNAGGGRFSPPVHMGMPGAMEFAVHDLNGDGHLDLYSSSLTSSQIVVLLGQGDGRLLEMPRVPLAAPPVAVVAFDVNEDGRADLIAADATGHISEAYGHGTGLFTMAAGLNAGAEVRHLAACDVDRDGDADLAVLTGEGVQIWRNTSGYFARDTLYIVSGPSRLQAADLNADGIMDLAVAQGAEKSIQILQGTHSGQFVRGMNVEFADSVWSLDVADLDSDGDLDLATGGSRSVGVAYFGTTSDVGDESAPLPKNFELSQNFPNPFNPSTEISFALPVPTRVTLEVFNLLGRRVALLKDEVMAAGLYSVRWDAKTESGTPLPSGVYFYRLRTPDATLTRRMMLLK